MAQLTQVQEAQRALSAHLEEVRIQLARKQEREAVEARFALELEKQAAMHFMRRPENG